MEYIRLRNITSEQIERWNKEIRDYNLHNPDISMEIADEKLKNDVINTSNELLNISVIEEPLITSFLNSIIGMDSYFEGMEHRIKDIKRLEEKMCHRVLDFDRSLETVSEEIFDVIRYTIIFPYDCYKEHLDEFLNLLEENGYTIHKIKNKWNDVFCKGVQVQIIDPNNIKFEIQFHTKENYIAKEIFSREPYKLTRKKGVPMELYVKSTLLRRLYHSKVRTPFGMEDYEYKSISKKL